MERYKLIIRLSLFFFMALPRIIFTIIINRNHGRALLFIIFKVCIRIYYILKTIIIFLTTVMRNKLKGIKLLTMPIESRMKLLQGGDASRG
jgi:hypothetical protein